MPLLTAEKLTVLRGDRELLRGFDLVLGAGELVHLRGANGAGKTSLLETLAGLRRPGEGKIRLSDDEARPHWLGHRNGLNLQLSPLDNLRFWCGLNGVAAAGIEPALTRLGLDAPVAERGSTLSAGQKRRSALARLLLQPRALWLLDEPLDGLDAAGLQLFAELIAGQLQTGGAVLMTSHQPLPGSLAARELQL